MSARSSGQLPLEYLDFEVDSKNRKLIPTASAATSR